MSITLGNPIIITSGTLGTKISPRPIFPEKLQWHQPTGDSTSSLVIRKRNSTGAVLATLLVEASGQSQVLSWTTDPLTQWIEPFCDCVPTGTLYIHTK